ncbi:MULTISPECIES: membrane-targeted effector domain-containing toxin [unclassified Pseudomonas]|uniref:membrane-targeted effector domain-containing toxin n=1 Tax=unclassified Pseudomonas TaxID=196821 RepID=UPI000BCD046E|nr:MULTISPECIES: membrane-targeted effector domain-containing toxin [unclassified Pseudomonas]PVZ15607.1 hypothetical protein F474_02385 [Pseudomonas sp. URIL14HWK12:I12]PVZ24981.1 hypothetical protein F470_02040 [Pseudomonas sp. URIL14HWK12:I10]PVZ34827.1 hypothetical protein F472_02386 [Pseudomonas sp. URIL14HWK12:I11]SNZ09388.1 hypothetical protein SAMN05660463_01373 [Pseudomonas sp. URIL14HWK12:I9]
MPTHTTPSTLYRQLVRQALAGLAEASTRLQSRLRQLPQADALGSSSGAPDLRAALGALAGFWAMREADNIRRREHYAKDLEQAMRKELEARIARGNLHTAYRHCLPSYHDEPGVSLFTLGVRLNEEHTAPLQGAVVFAREQGPTLLYVSGAGWVGAPALPALLNGLTHSINQPELRSPLLGLMPAKHRQAMQAIEEEPSLELEAFDTDDWVLTPLLASPFHTLAEQLIDLQRQDLAWAFEVAGAAPDRQALQQLISQAITAPARLSPATIAQVLYRAWIDQAPSDPDWLLNAPAEQREQCLAALQRYDHLRQALLSALNGCATLQDFSRSRLSARIANDLGLDIDPDQMQITLNRSLPITGERYQITKTLTQLAIDGLHPGDLTPNSPYLNDTRISLAGRPVEPPYTALTPAYVGELVTQLAVYQPFCLEQRQTHALGSTHTLLSKLMREHLVALGWLARVQGHISPSDHALLSAFCAGQPPVIGHLEANRVILADRFELRASLVIRHLDTEGSTLRLLVYCADAPTGRSLMAFDTARQLVAEWVGWAADAPTRDLLLANVLPQQREAFGTVLEALAQRPFPERPATTSERPWYIDAQGNPQPIVVATPAYAAFLRLEPVSDAIGLLTRQHIQMAQAQAAHELPGALTAQRSSYQQLGALNDQIAGAVERYASHPHTAVPDFERYVHSQAREKINALLERADDLVDPDSIVIQTPRETLTYTQMLRDGYDDSLGLLTPTADTTATFSGPPGVDLSALTPQQVAGSVRGAWLADRYIADIEQRLLAPDSPGRAWRRQQSVLILQLQMQRSALRARLEGTLPAADYTWINTTLLTLADTRLPVRQRHPVYPMQFELRNPLVASAAALGEAFVAVYEQARRLLPLPSMMHLETIQGCYIVTPHPGTADNAWAYTPNAPDGQQWRRLDTFRATLASPGMGDYYKDRCSLSLGRLIAFFIADIRNSGASQPPALPPQVCTDLADSCHDAILRRRIDDVRHTTTSRSDMIANIARNTVELAATALTLPFPLASFAVGATLALRDYSKGLKAFAEGNEDEAGLLLFSALLNGAGAAGDLTSGLKGFGHLIRQARPTRATRPLLEPAGPLPVPLGHQLVYAGKSHGAHVHEVLHAAEDGSLTGSGRYVRQNKDGAWQRLDAASAPHPSAQAYAVEVDLSRATPLTSSHAQGVVQLEGRFYIAMGQQHFQVQYVAADRCWYIVDPANPFSFSGRQPVVRNAQGQWARLSPAGLLGGAPTGTATTRSVTSAYELPTELHNHAMAIACPPGTPAARALEQWAAPTHNALVSTAKDTYARLRSTLAHDASAWYQGLALPPRPSVVAPAAGPSGQALVEIAAHHRGVVIAETLNSPASKKLLIDSMPALAEQGVTVLYLEHLLADIHAAKLQKYKALGARARSGSRTLKHFYAFAHHGLLAPKGSGLDYYHLIKAAHRHGIEVRALNTSVSYDFGLAPAAEGAASATRMRGFIANRIIGSACQAAPEERWIALLEHRLALAHDGVPGVAQVQGVVSVRVEDAGGPALTGNIAAADLTLHLEAAPPQAAQPVPTPEERVNWTLDPKTLELHVRRHDPGAGAKPAAMLKRDRAGRWVADPDASLPVTEPSSELQLRLWDAEYHLPPQHIATFHKIKAHNGKALDNNYFTFDTSIHPTQEAFFSLRAKILNDSHAVLTQVLPPRPELPNVNLIPGDAALLRGIYDKTRGLVVGEAHAHVGSKQFLIDNLDTLLDCNVKTLYLEHLLADANQLDLDHFVQTGVMSRQLLDDLRTLDWGHHTDSAKTYNFEQLVVRARDKGLDIRAIDCAATYRLDGMDVMGPQHTTRQRMMNFYANRAIERHQAAVGAHNWVALVGNTHANTYQQTVPGLAELQGAIGLRVRDVPPGQGHAAIADPGEIASARGGREVMVKCDLLLAVQPHGHRAPLAPEQRLHRPGQYLIDSSDPARSYIWHRSRNGEVHQTAITTRADGRLYVDRPSWSTVHGRPFDDLAALTAAMRDFGMIKVD